jgi:hypothetical protein
VWRYLGLLVVALLEPLLPLLDDVVTGQQALVLSDLITSQNIRMSGNNKASRIVAGLPLNLFSTP